jgi:two-component system LytT family response regulator
MSEVKIKSILIDDEPMARDLLNSMLNEHCQQVEVLAQCSNLPDAIKAIKKHKPDLIFLDIEMPGYSGLDIFDFFDQEEVNFSIIFVTAYNKFAVQAFKLSAVDYLLKPIEAEDLINAVQRYEKTSKANQYSHLKEMVTDRNLQKLAIQSQQSIRFVNLDDIIYLKGEGAYTHFYLKDGSTIMSSKNLKNYEEILNIENGFYRSHKSNIINYRLVSDIKRTDGTTVVLDKVHTLPIAAERVGDLVKLLSR